MPTIKQMGRMSRHIRLWYLAAIAAATVNLLTVQIAAYWYGEVKAIMRIPVYRPRHHTTHRGICLWRCMCCTIGSLRQAIISRYSGAMEIYMLPLIFA